MKEKKMSASGITVPRMANGRRGAKPAAENRIQVTREWESASTPIEFSCVAKRLLVVSLGPATERHAQIVILPKGFVA
jgi:hypothetical protein